MRFNRTKFFNGFRPYFKEIADRPLTSAQVANLEMLLANFEASTWFCADIRRIAYALATAHVETYLPRPNLRYAPVTEGGGRSYFNKYEKAYAPRKARELGNKQQGDGYLFRGRGYVQITGRTNYTHFGIADNPEEALDPSTAFRIMEEGMRSGVFTTHKLGDYINAGGADYKGARRVINGQDRAGEIAGYARNFEHFLRESLISAVAPAVSPTTDQDSGSGADPIAPAMETPTDPQEALPLVEQSPTTESTIETHAETSEGQTADVTTTATGQNVAVEKEENLPFWKKIWKKLTGWVAYAGGLGTIQSYHDQVQSLGIPEQIILYVIEASLAAFVLWLLYEGLLHIWSLISRRWLTTSLVTANATPTNSVTVITADQVADYEKKGWTVVKRA